MLWLWLWGLTGSRLNSLPRLVAFSRLLASRSPYPMHPLSVEASGQFIEVDSGLEAPQEDQSTWKLSERHDRQ